MTGMRKLAFITVSCRRFIGFHARVYLNHSYLRDWLGNLAMKTMVLQFVGRSATLHNPLF